jgi:hypothetical protein
VLTLLVVYVTKQYQTPSGLLIGSLALTDLLVGGFLLPFGIRPLLDGDWTSGRYVCILNGFTNQYLCTVAILTLAAISLDRYVAIIHAMRYHQIMTPKRVKLLIVMLWAFGLLLAIIPFVGWGRYVYEPGASLCVTDFKKDKSFTFFIFIVVFGIPLNAIFFMYSQIFMVVRKQVKSIRSHSIHPTNQNTEVVANDVEAINQRASGLANGNDVQPTNQRRDESTNRNISKPTGQTTDRGRELSNDTALRPSNLNRLTNEAISTNQEAPSKTSSTNQSTSLCLSTNQTKAYTTSREHKPTNQTTSPVTKSFRKKLKHETKAALTMLTIIGVFVLSLTPYTAYTLYCLHTGESYETADFITSKIAYSNAIFNPLIYGLMNKLFKKGFYQVFNMIFRCKKSRIDSEWKFSARSSFSK